MGYKIDEINNELTVIPKEQGLLPLIYIYNLPRRSVVILNMNSTFHSKKKAKRLGTRNGIFTLDLNRKMLSGNHFRSGRTNELFHSDLV